MEINRNEGKNKNSILNGMEMTFKMTKYNKVWMQEDSEKT